MTDHTWHMCAHCGRPVPVGPPPLSHPTIESHETACLQRRLVAQAAKHVSERRRRRAERDELGIARTAQAHNEAGEWAGTVVALTPAAAERLAARKAELAAERAAPGYDPFDGLT